MRCFVESSVLLDVSAASAVVAVDDLLFVVADDGIELVGFDRDGVRARSIPLGIAELPIEPRARKARKPDVEAVVDLGEGVVAALGSGSTLERRRGWLVSTRRSDVRPVDLTGLHRALDERLPELNLEGAVVLGESILLAQRGNGASRSNAIVVLDAATTKDGLSDGAVSAASLRDVVPVDLGSLDDVALSMTDLAVDATGRLWFSAAAEDTRNTYEDGACVGSILGRFDERFRVVEVMRIEGREKVEGVAFDPNDPSGASAVLVVDPDDPARSARCLRVRLVGD